MLKPKVIKNAAEYEAALAHIETLMDDATSPAKVEELELFAVLVENYEQEHFPIGQPDQSRRRSRRGEQT